MNQSIEIGTFPCRSGVRDASTAFSSAAGLFRATFVALSFALTRARGPRIGLVPGDVRRPQFCAYARPGAQDWAPSSCPRYQPCIQRQLFAARLRAALPPPRGTFTCRSGVRDASTAFVFPGDVRRPPAHGPGLGHAYIMSWGSTSAWSWRLAGRGLPSGNFSHSRRFSFQG